MIRSSTLATFPVALAAAETLARSNSESTLTKVPLCTASLSSQGSLPLPLKMVRAGSKPAFRASASSFPDTSTAPDPRPHRWRRMGRLLLALTA